MIKWLCTLPVLKEIYRQGGIDSFALAQRDILETMADDIDKKADERMQEKMSQMLSPVNYNQVISQNKRTGFLYLGKEQCDDATILNLKAEAELITKSSLWPILIETPKELAMRAMFVEGDLKSFEKGRAMLYHIDSQKQIVELLAAYAQRAKPPNS